MKFLLAPDKFRGSLTAEEVCSAMAEGIRAVLPAADIIMLPMADGGEGTAEILTFDARGTMLTTTVADPLGRSIEAAYGISADGATAFIEMASASGLRLLESDERNPCLTSTFGTGQLILEAVRQGANHIVLGIGGSATTDAGIGMAAALGWQFWDAEGQPLEPNGENLIKIHKIVRPASSPKIHVEVACDVTAPLYGFGGAAQLYAPQKGATPEMVTQLDKGLKHLADLIKKDFGLDLAHVPGAGAAGGLGFGALFFLGATLKEGVKIVMEQTHFAEKLEGVNWIFTGEGKIDEQTLQGKLIAGIANAAHLKGIPVVALCGALLVSPDDIRRIGLTYATSIINRPMTLDEAIASAYTGVKDASQQLTQLFCKISNVDKV